MAAAGIGAFVDALGSGVVLGPKSIVSLRWCDAMGILWATAFIALFIVFVTALPSWGEGYNPLEHLTTYGNDYSAFDGNTLVRNVEGNATRRQMVKINGYTILPRNLWCGYAARKELEKQKKEGRLMVREIPSVAKTNQIDTMLVPGKQEFALHMIRSGLAKCDETCSEELRAAEEECRRQKCGCIWSTNDLDEGMTLYDDYGEAKPSPLDLEGPSNTDRASRRGSIISFEADKSTAERLITSNRFPTGFTMKKHVINYMRRPVDFLFLPDNTLIVALNEGTVKSVDENQRIRDTDFLDVRDITNDYHDHGLMSIAISPDYDVNPFLYFFIVYDHITDPDYYTQPRTSRVMKVAPDETGLAEDVSTRQTILGTMSGFGCGACEQTDPDCDCIPAEGKSHVGGGLAFTPSGELYVAVGDGGIAWIVPEALRAQQFGTFSGKILKVDKDGRGFESNPWYDGNVLHRNSKIYALGVRNVLHLHVSPKNPKNVYMGDTQWHTKEEVTVVRSASNSGWPCFESTEVVVQYQDDIECTTFSENFVHNEPLIGWDHGPSTASSMIGERAAFQDFPRRYRDVLLYGDMAMRFIGFAKLDDDDNLIEDLERIFVSEAAVQMREGPDGCLYFVSVRGAGELRQVCYEPDPTHVRLENIDPSNGTIVSAANLVISGTFSKTVEPGTVNSSNIFLSGPDDVVVPSTLNFDFNTRSFTLTPDSPLTGGTAYQILCRGTATGLLDLDHNILTDNIVVDFMTSGAGDTTPPTIISTIPQDQSVGREPQTSLRIVFSEAMDSGSLTGNFKIEPVRYEMADRTFVTIGEPREILSTTYLTSARELSFTADLEFSTLYLVTLFGGREYIYDTSGNALEKDYTFSFATGENPNALTATIFTPVVGTEAAVNEVVNFSGEAYTRNGDPIPPSAFNWQIILHHCTYGVPTCHSHGEYIITDAKEGSFKAPNHYDRFYYEIYLTVSHGDDTVDTSRIVETKKVDFTLTSNPPGILLSLSGYSKQTPFTESVVVGSVAQLSSPLYAGEDNYLEFLEWQDKGARTKELVVGGSNMTFLAKFVERTPESTATPIALTATPSPTPAVVAGAETISFVSPPARVPTSGTFEFDVEYSALFNRDIFVAISPEAGGPNVDRNRFQVPLGNHTRKITFVMSAVLQPNVAYLLKIDIRELDAEWTSKIDKKTVSVVAGSNVPQEEDWAILIDPPTNIPQSGTVELVVQFGTSITRDLAVLILGHDPQAFITETIITVSGTGTKNFVLDYDLLIEGRMYDIGVEVREVGGDFSTRLYRMDYSTTAGTAPQVTDLIIDLERPTEPHPLDSLVNVNVTYTARETRSIYISMHRYPNTLWIGGKETFMVPATSEPTVLILPIQVARLDRIATGEQIKVRASIRPVGTMTTLSHKEHIVWA